MEQEGEEEKSVVVYGENSIRYSYPAQECEVRVFTSLEARLSAFYQSFFWMVGLRVIVIENASMRIWLLITESVVHMKKDSAIRDSSTATSYLLHCISHGVEIKN